MGLRIGFNSAFRFLIRNVARSVGVSDASKEALGVLGFKNIYSALSMLEGRDFTRASQGTSKLLYKGSRLACRPGGFVGMFPFL